MLRLVLVDARLSNVMWIGEFSSDALPRSAPHHGGIAAKLADAIASQ